MLPPGVLSYFGLDVTGFVKDLVDVGDQYAGFTVKPGSNGGIFIADPAGTTPVVAKLRVEAVPEPSSIVTLGTVLVLLAVVLARPRGKIRPLA